MCSKYSLDNYACVSTSVYHCKYIVQNWPITSITIKTTDGVISSKENNITHLKGASVGSSSLAAL